MKILNPKILILSGLILLLFSSAYSQNIENEAGIRLGSTSALTYKRLFANLEAVELMLSGRNNGIQLIGLYEKHKPLVTGLGENFYTYYGFGGHIGYLQSDPLIFRDDTLGPYINGPALDIRRQTFFTLGIDAIIGVEYHIYSVPMTVAVDFKPFVELIGMRHLRSEVFDFAVSAKYIF